MRTPLAPDQFDPARHPRKLNLGSGSDYRDGYVNVDMNAWHGPDLLADVSDPAFLPSQHYDEILAQDVLEHLPRTETVRVLARWNRLLRVGGRIVLRVPSVTTIAEQLARTDDPAMQEELIQALFGTQAYTGDFHFTSFTRVLLEHYLRQAGFRPVTIAMGPGSNFDVVAEKVAHHERPPVPDFAPLAQIPRDEDFVVACYREILQREPDEGGKAYYVDGLRAGGMSREVVIKAMLGGEEYRALRARG